MFSMLRTKLIYSRPALLDDEDVPKRRTALRKAYDKTYWLWILVITVDLAVQALRTATSTAQMLSFISKPLCSRLCKDTDFWSYLKIIQKRWSLLYFC